MTFMLLFISSQVTKWVPGYFLRKTGVKGPFSMIVLLKCNNSVRLYDVDSVCTPAFQLRVICRLTFALNIQQEKKKIIISSCQSVTHDSNPDGLTTALYLL